VTPSLAEAQPRWAGGQQQPSPLAQWVVPLVVQAELQQAARPQGSSVLTQ